MQRRQTTSKGAGEPALGLWEEPRLLLLAERRQVIGALAGNTPGRSGSEDNGQESDSASISHIRDSVYSYREALSRRLHILDDALERISVGVYGLCAECGARIVDKRLAGDPAVAFCVACQAASESQSPTPTL